MGGIGRQGEVGFLTLFEAYKSLEVGTHLKVPVHPIWVVCSESHYSTLFSSDVSHTKVDESVRKLDIYYYDPLGEQEEEVKLTLDKDASDIPEDGGDETDLIPPIDKVGHYRREGWGEPSSKRESRVPTNYLFPPLHSPQVVRTKWGPVGVGELGKGARPEGEKKKREQSDSRCAHTAHTSLAHTLGPLNWSRKP